MNTKNRTYHIICNGTDMGTYEGSNEDEALDALAVDAGYADYADLLARVPTSSRDEVEVEVAPVAITRVRVYPDWDEDPSLVPDRSWEDDSWVADDLDELRESGVNAAHDGRWAVVEFSDGEQVTFEADTDGWAPSDRRDAIRHDYAWLSEAVADLLAAMNA